MTTNAKRYGKEYRKTTRRGFPEDVCPVCKTDLDIDPESGERHCRICESPEP